MGERGRGGCAMRAHTHARNARDGPRAASALRADNCLRLARFAIVLGWPDDPFRLPKW